MGLSVLAYGGGNPKKCLFLLVVLIAIVCPAITAISIPEYTPYFNYDPRTQYGQDVSHYNTSVELAERIAPNTTPWELWIGAIIISLVLFLYSLRPVQTHQDLEVAIVTSTLAALSSAFAAYASFGIDRLAGYGVTSQIFNTTTQAQAQFYNHEYVYMEHHLIYSEPAVGILMVVLFFVIVGYTLYRIGTHQSIVGTGDEI